MRLRHIALFVFTAALGGAFGRYVNGAAPIVPVGYDEKKHLAPADTTPASTLPAPLNTTYSFLDPTSPVQAQLNGKLSATDPRVCPVSAGGKLYYDIGSGCGESAAGSANQVWTSTGAGAPAPVSTLNGISHIGTYSLGGVPSLAANLSGGGLFKFTNLAAPTIGSTDSATAQYAEAQKTGSIVTIGVLGPGLTWSANNFIGNVSGTNATAGNLGTWHTAVPGVLKNFEHNSATTGVSSPTNITIYKASTPGPTFGCGSFSATTAVIPIVTGGARGINTTTSVTLIAGDCIALRTDQIINSGNPGSLVETAQFIPN